MQQTLEYLASKNSAIMFKKKNFYAKSMKKQ